MDLYRSRPLNLQRLIVAAHLRTTGVPGQGVDCRLLRHVAKLSAPYCRLGRSGRLRHGVSLSSCGCGI